MNQLLPHVVTTWNGAWPKSIAIACGYCGKNEIFRPEDWKRSGSVGFTWALCPGCREAVSFLVTNYQEDSKPLGGGDLLMHPSRPEWFVSDQLNIALKQNPELHRDYWMGVHNYNSGEPIGVVMASRRALEGLAALADDLKVLGKHHDLSQVLYEMSEAIKDAGNLGAHYGASRLNNEIASSCFQLASDFIQLHVLLEQRVKELKGLVAEARLLPIPTKNS